MQKQYYRAIFEHNHGFLMQVRVYLHLYYLFLFGLVCQVLHPSVIVLSLTPPYQLMIQNYNLLTFGDPVKTHIEPEAQHAEADEYPDGA